jgi:fatty acid desaturase
MEGATNTPIERDLLRDWSRRDDAPGLRRAAGHLGLLLATGVLVWALRGTLLIWPAMLLHGVVLVFLFAPLHECIHRTAFKRRAFNDAFGLIAGLVLLLPQEYFRAFHFAHHRFTQDPARDPELGSPKPRNVRQWLWRVSGSPYWVAEIRGIVGHAFGRLPETFYTNDRQGNAVIAEARIALAVYTAVAVLSLWTHSDAALIYWVVPVLLGQPALRLYLMAEHTLCPTNDDMLENTRTTYTNGLVRFLAWNMPYHAEHHAFPAVPFHRLPEVNRVIGSRLKSTAAGYCAVQRQILNSFARAS